MKLYLSNCLVQLSARNRRGSHEGLQPFFVENQLTQQNSIVHDASTCGGRFQQSVLNRGLVPQMKDSPDLNFLTFDPVDVTWISYLLSIQP